MSQSLLKLNAKDTFLLSIVFIFSFHLLHDGNVEPDHGGSGQNDVEDTVQGEQVNQDVGVRTSDIMKIVGKIVWNIDKFTWKNCISNKNIHVALCIKYVDSMKNSMKNKYEIKNETVFYM